MFRFLLLIASTTLIAIDAYGEPICGRNSSNSALIIIDMQPGFITRGGNHEVPSNIEKVRQIIDQQVIAINHAKEKQIPIVFLEYVGDYGDTNESLRDQVKNYDRVKFFKKDSDGMFEKYNKYLSNLSDYLKKNDIGTVIITGANGGACVESSIRGALENECNVIALSQGIADFNFTDFIYPYAGYYKASIGSPTCKNCTFSEVSSIDGTDRFMINNSNNRNKGANSAPQSKNGKSEGNGSTK